MASALLGAGGGGVSRRTVITAAIVAVGAYLKARSMLLARAERAGTRIGPRWLGLLAFKLLYLFSELAGVSLGSESGEGLEMIDPSRRYLIIWHPHGFLAWSALFVLSRMALVGHPHGREWFAMVAPALFRIPLISEALMLVNGRRVDRKVVERLANMGKSFALQPGGVKEQLASRHDQEQAIFPANLGFIRLALQHGMDLLPAYVFNENQMFKRATGYDKLSKWIYAKTGFGVPFATGRFGIPIFFLAPVRTKVHTRWGAPIVVGEKVANPTDEQIEELFCRYLVGLQKLFDKYAHECLPAEVADRGLKIIRLDGKPLPPSLAALANSESDLDLSPMSPSPSSSPSRL